MYREIPGVGDVEVEPLHFTFHAVPQRFFQILLIDDFENLRHTRRTNKLVAPSRHNRHTRTRHIKIQTVHHTRTGHS